MLVAEVPERERQERSSCKHKATAHEDKAQAKIGKYSSINGTASAQRHFQRKLYNHPVSQIRMNKIAIIIQASFLKLKPHEFNAA